MSSSDHTYDLRELSPQYASVYKTTVALFKEEPDHPPRLLADSDTYLAYTLKNGRTLRFIARPSNTKGSLKHTGGGRIHAVKFVNYRSNVGASASEGEFLVWVVTNDSVSEDAANNNGKDATLTVKTYFKLQDPVTIHNFSFFINPTVGMPDLFILYGRKVAMLESSKLIERYTTETGTMEATLRSDSKELRHLHNDTSVDTLCSINNGGWFAFNSSETQVIASTLENRSTPAWMACTGEAVRGLELLNFQTVSLNEKQTADDTAHLIASSDRFLFRWVLSAEAEPQLLQRFSFGTAIVALRSSHDVLAVFNSDKQLALIQFSPSDANSANFQSSLFQLESLANGRSVCFQKDTSKETNGRFNILLDATSQIEQYQVNTSKPVAATPNDGVVKKLPQHFNDPSIIAATPAGGEAASSLPPPTTTESYAPAAAAAPAVPANVTAAVQQAKAALLSNSLLHLTDGPIPMAICQGDESFRSQLERLETIMKNIMQVLQLTPEQLSRDHSQLLHLALEAQMTELQQTLQGGGGGSGAAVAAGGRVGVDKAQNEAYTSYTVASLLVPISKDIASGVTRGIHETLRTELDTAVRQALGDHLRDSQKQILRKRLDDALRNSSGFFAQEIQTKLQRFSQCELRSALEGMNGTISKLMEENRSLQVALRDMMDLNTAEEINRLRNEVRGLRSQLASVQSGTAATGGSGISSFQARPAPDTLRRTSTDFLRKGQYKEGLEYLALGQDPSITYDVLFELNEDAYNELLGDANVSDDLWTRILLLLVKYPDPKEAVIMQMVQILGDVIAERQGLAKPTSAEGQLLLSDVRHFIQSAKTTVKQDGKKRALKALEKLIQ